MRYTFFHYREVADVDEFFITGDHDHYISSETIVLPTEIVKYEEIPCEPKPKRREFGLFFPYWFNIN